MNNTSDKPDHLSSAQQILLTLKKTRSKLEAAERAKTEPIAIIGMGCRLAGGANDPASFWRLLREGKDGITEIPPSRWDVDGYYDPNPNAPGKIYTRYGGFLDQVDQFDAKFFGISPREALALDPQQRFLLQVSWEALEDAGVAPDQLVGSRTGVFIGIGQNDYAYRQLNSVDSAAHIDTYHGTGNGFCFASGRLSYILGLLGPNLAIDTACSSSLVAVHLACQSLRSGESDLVLAGGVQLILSPEVTIFLCRAHALSPDGRCKTFDANANGYGRGEGCGVLVLKRLSDAVANRDNILALIRGSATNHDGPSSGLTVPNGLAQQALIRQALENSKEDPSRISYVETHGTGTSLGDPIEVRALESVLGKGRSPQEPLFIGSVKTNIGHLEAAAGVAGLIKVVLALQNQEIPPHLHFKEPNPHINWNELPIAVPTKPIPWTTQGQPRLAGVSSFGISGTNAHAIVQEAPEREPIADSMECPLHILTLSAKTDNALWQLLDRYKKYLIANPALAVGNICFTTNRGRSHFNHRLSIVASSTSELTEKLVALADGQPIKDIQIGQVKQNTPPQVAFLFTGEDCQYIGMGQQLYNTQPTFRAALEHCAQILQSYLEQPLIEILYTSSAKNSPLNTTPYKEVVLFTIEYALFQLWQSWGIQPAIVLGHSVGEYVAACAAGVFNLEDAIKLIVEHARLKQVSAPNSTALAKFDQVSREITYLSPQIKVISTASGELVTQKIGTSEYWSRYVLNSSSHTDRAITTLAQQDCVLFIECGPQPTQLDTSVLKETGICLASLCSTQPDWQQILHSLSTLYVHGVSVNWTGFHQGYPYYSCQLPTYPFQEQRYWIDLNENEHQQVELEPQKHIETPIVDFLNQGDSQKLVQLLTKGGKFSPEKLQLLPELVEELIRQHQQQLATASIKDWFYRIMWELKPRQTEKIPLQSTHSQEPGSWLILADAHGVAESLATLLQSQGQTCFLIYPGEEYKNQQTNRIWYINPSQPSHFERLLQEVTATHVPLQKVIHCWSLEVTSTDKLTISTLEQSQILGCGSTLHLLQALVKYSEFSSSRLWLVTQGAMPVLSTVSAVAQAPIWGFGKVLSLEYPELWGGMLDLDPQDTFKDTTALLAEIRNSQGEDHLAFRSGQRYVARLVSNPLPEAQKVGLCSDATYLIAGGLGALGLQVAQWMVKQGVRNLVLTGRSKVSEPVQETINCMQQAGVTILTAQADVSSEMDMVKVLEQVRVSMPPIKGIIHAAGVPGYQPLVDVDLQTLKSVLKPKVIGSWNLHQLTQDLKLDFFIGFSSIASVWGSKGQAHYAAANSFLDALAYYRQSSGLPGLSINWGPWAQGGMAASEEAQQWLTRMGVQGLQPEQAIAALEFLLQGDSPQTTFAHVDWTLFKSIYEMRGQRPLLEKIKTSIRQVEQQQTNQKLELIQNLEAAPKSERLTVLTNYLQGEVAQVLRLEKFQLPEAQRGFFEMGMDSLMAIELKERLENSLGASFPATLILEFPNIQDLAKYIAQDILPVEFFSDSIPELQQVEPTTDLSATLQNMSQDEIADLLAKKLASLD